MGKNIKILVCAHKDSRLPQHEYFCPIQVGAALTSARFFPVLDNTGDNISDRNPHFCELTAHYWAWKNLKCDIIGLNHYTRFLSISLVPASVSLTPPGTNLQTMERILRNVALLNIKV